MIKEHYCVSGENIENTHIRQMCDFLKRAENPLVLYGTGGMAKKIAIDLDKQGIAVDYICESSDFFEEGKKFNGKDVWRFDDFRDRHENYNVIVGSSNEALQKKMKMEGDSDPNINKVLIFPWAEAHYTMTPEWVLSNAPALDESYDMMSDDESRNVFISFINAHAKCMDTSILLSELWTEDAYFNSLYHPDLNNYNVMVDCGAFDGDSARAFFDFAQKKGFEARVLAFEPFEKAFHELETSMKAYGDRVKCYPLACGKEDKITYFKTDGYVGSVVVDYPTDDKVRVVRGDDFLKDEPVTLIKMDLEGSEMEALEGFEGIIRSQHPFLAICVYHKIDDLICIPQYIRSISGEAYDYYLRHHSYGCHDTVLYAVPKT